MPNRFPDDQTPDDATPDNATPDGSSSKGSSSSNESPPPPSSNKSPPPPPSSNKSPPPPSSHKPPSPPSSNQASSHNSPPPPSSNQASSHKSPSSNQSPSHKSPPPPPPSGENSSTNENNGNDDMTRIGVGVGAGFFLLLLICICLICSRRKKNKQKYYYSADPSQGTDYLFATPHRDNTSQYGSYRHHSGQHPHPNWQAGPGPYGGPPSGVWSGPHPLNSGEMSSNYTLGMGPPPPPGLSLNLMGGSGTFTYEELAAATGGFARENIIGQGGFGFVHKGVLSSGKEVAVKGLKAGSGQGEREFQAEIEIISRVHHRHLVTLVGYCIAGGQRMLVYEFVPNNTLEHHLHGKGVPTMDWATRMKIAIGSAKGLAYLHEDCSPRIIHRDIKASNVLIDNSFEAKVADFGLAKLTTDTNTHVSTRVMGTFGYLAPEYAASGKLSEKSDVFSFGVMLLELITGKRPIDLTNTMDESLVDWARPLLSQALEVEGNFKELVDPFLEGNYNPLEMAKMAACASASIRHSARKRPKMSQIVKILEGDVTFDDLKEGMLKPSGQSSSYSSNVGGSDQYDTKQYDADMIKFRQAIMSSQEFGNSS